MSIFLSLYVKIISTISPLSLQMDWGEQTTGLDKLQTDLTQSWEYLRAIAKHETSTDTTSMEKKMKCAQSLTEAAQKLKVSKTATPTFHYITLLIISLSVCVCVAGTAGGPSESREQIYQTVSLHGYEQFTGRVNTGTYTVCSTH